MPMRILTIPFDPVHQCFPDDDLKHFLLNKRVRSTLCRDSPGSAVPAPVGPT